MSNKKANKHFSGYFKNVLKDYGFYSTLQDIYITKVIYNNPAVIVFWSDDTKTTAKCSGGDKYNPEIGLYLATLKKFGGSSVSHLYDDWKPIRDDSNMWHTDVVEVSDVRKRRREVDVE